VKRGVTRKYRLNLLSTDMTENKALMQQEVLMMLLIARGSFHHFDKFH
jgi:hypothetical protein